MPQDNRRDQEFADLMSLREAERILMGAPGQEVLLVQKEEHLKSGKGCRKKGGPTREVKLQSLLQRNINLQRKRPQLLEQQQGLQVQMDKINEDLDKVETELESVREELREHGVEMQSEEDWEEDGEEEELEEQSEDGMEGLDGEAWTEEEPAKKVSAKKRKKKKKNGP